MTFRIFEKGHRIKNVFLLKQVYKDKIVILHIA
jgi:hypothetical protein